MATVKLPEGVEVHIGGAKFVGEIPEHLCPEKHLPAKAKEQPAKEPRK